MSKLYTLAIGIGSDPDFEFHADTCARKLLQSHPIDHRTKLTRGWPWEDLVTVRLLDTSPASVARLELDLNRFVSGSRSRGSLNAWWCGTAAQMPVGRR